MRAVFVVFLFGHAAVHGVMWTLPFTDAVDDMPFDPAESWLIGTSPIVGIGLAGLAAVGLGIAAVGFAIRATWWPMVLGASAVVSLVVMGLFWSSYWIVGVAISAALGTHAWQADASG